MGVIRGRCAWFLGSNLSPLGMSLATDTATRRWHRRTCDAVVCGPPLNTHCSALEGPAAVRISSAQALLGLLV